MSCIINKYFQQKEGNYKQRSNKHSRNKEHSKRNEKCPERAYHWTLQSWEKN